MRSLCLQRKHVEIVQGYFAKVTHIWLVSLVVSSASCMSQKLSKSILHAGELDASRLVQQYASFRWTFKSTEGQARISIFQERFFQHLMGSRINNKVHHRLLSFSIPNVGNSTYSTLHSLYFNAQAPGQQELIFQFW